MKTTKYILTLALTVCCALGNLYAINSSYYNSIDGKKDSGLRNALYDIIKVGPTGMSYDGLWTAYTTTDVYPSDSTGKAGKIWDMYSNVLFTAGTNQCGSYSNVGDCYNREHSLPKSWFSEAKPAYYDLGHIVPTDGYVNNQRSNYAFGECASGTRLTNGNKKGLGKLGTSTFSGYTNMGKVFEPDDIYKGDFARMYMYMVVRYKPGNSNNVNLAASGDGQKMFNSTDANYGLTDYSIALLMKWHRNDPVSQKEIDRNNGMQTVQGNRNPFIDYPCLAEYLWGNKAGETVSLSSLVGTFTGSWTTGDGCPCGDVPTITLPTGDIYVGSTEANNPVSKNVMVQGVNLTAGLTFAISGTNSSLFSLSSSTMTQSVATTGANLAITYTPTTAGNHSAVLTISGGGLSSNQTFNLSGTCCNPYVVTLSRNGITETVGACGTYTLPAAEDEDDPCDGWEFKGWVTSGTSFTEGQTSAPTFVTEVCSATTLYAVYGKTETTGGSSPSSASYTFKSKSWTATEGNWTSGKDGNGYSNNGVQVTTGSTGANANCPNSYSNITSIVVSYCTNSSSGAGSIKMEVGAATQTQSVTKTGGTTARNLTFDFSSTKPSGSPKITVTCSTNSIYVCGVTITYGGGSTTTTTYKKLPCTTYTISYADADGIATGGSYQASATTALAGTTITLDYDEAMGYEFTGWTVTKAGGGSVTVTSDQFTMPEANVTVQANFTALCSKLSAPDVTATAGDGQITLTWSDVSDADHYTVTIGTGVGYTTECSSPIVGDISHSGTTNTCVITGLTNGLEYTTYVVANGVSSICDSDADEDTTTPTAVLVNSHNVTFTPSPTGATVTVNGESTSPQSVNYNATVTVAVTPASHYTLTSVTVNGTSGSVDVSGSDNTRTFTMPDEDVTVTVTMTEETKYTVNWYVNGTATAETKYAGETLEGISNPSIDCNGKVFQGWTATANYSSETTAPNDLFTDASTKTMPSNNTTSYYAVFATETTTTGGTTTSIVDELTRATTGITGTSYSEWSGKSGTSGAVYAGQSAGGNSSIQLRSTSPSGIITTTSGGKATKVTVTWNTNTINDRKLNVYGKNTSYESAADLYNNSKCGTLIGNIVYGTSTELTISDDYEYIGLCSASNAIYLTSVSITWSSTSAGTTTTTISDYTTTCSTPITYTVTWSVLGGEEISTATYREGATIEFPADPTGCEDKEFVGWTTEPILLTDEEPTLVTSATMGTEDITFYAVFATATTSGGGSSSSLTKMGTGDTFADGDKIVIVANGTTVALYQETTNTSYVNKWTFDNDVATVTADNKKWLTVTATTGGWYLGDDVNGYINNKDNNLYCNSTKSVWELIDNEDGTFGLTSGRYLSYRSDLDTKYWRCGGTNGASGKSVLDIYKVTTASGTTTYSGYTTLCYEKYERTFNNVEDYATLCLPYSVNVLYLQGATAYSVAGKYVNNSTITGILLNEEETELAAGQSYVIQSTALTMNAWYSPRVDSLKAPVDTQGMVGNLSGKKIYVPVGCYGLSHNKLRKVASENTASIDHYKAYFVLNDDEEVPVVEESVIPQGSKVMHTTDDAPTALEQTNGQPSIDWNQPVYNILGIRVGKDATGVLIQNGIKYLR